MGAAAKTSMFLTLPKKFPSSGTYLVAQQIRCRECCALQPPGPQPALGRRKWTPVFISSFQRRLEPRGSKREALRRVLWARHTARDPNLRCDDERWFATRLATH